MILRDLTTAEEHQDLLIRYKKEENSPTISDSEKSNLSQKISILLSHNPSIKALKIENHEFDLVAFQNIGFGLTQNDKLEMLTIDCAENDYSCLLGLLAGLRGNIRIVSLVVSGTDLAINKNKIPFSDQFEVLENNVDTALNKLSSLLKEANDLESTLLEAPDDLKIQNAKKIAQNFIQQNQSISNIFVFLEIMHRLFTIKNNYHYLMTVEKKLVALVNYIFDRCDYRGALEKEPVKQAIRSMENILRMSEEAGHSQHTTQRKQGERRITDNEDQNHLRTRVHAAREFREHNRLSESMGTLLNLRADDILGKIAAFPWNLDGSCSIQLIYKTTISEIKTIYFSALEKNKSVFKQVEILRGKVNEYNAAEEKYETDKKALTTAQAEFNATKSTLKDLIKARVTIEIERARADNQIKQQAFETAEKNVTDSKNLFKSIKLKLEPCGGVDKVRAELKKAEAAHQKSSQEYESIKGTFQDYFIDYSDKELDMSAIQSGLRIFEQPRQQQIFPNPQIQLY